MTSRGSGKATWTLQIDHQDRPRMAFYQGFVGGSVGNTLYYGWCNSGCTLQSNWFKTDVNLPQGRGEDAALALDDQGRPRIAYHETGNGVGLGYLWCNTNCENDRTRWGTLMAESSDALNLDFPRLPQSGCDRASWLGGYRPALALDSSGNPRVAYDAIHYSAGGSCGSLTEGWRSVRTFLFNQPQDTGQPLSRPRVPHE